MIVRRECSLEDGREFFAGGKHSEFYDLRCTMLNIDPLLFQPKVIRMSTTSNIGQHIVRTTHYSNSSQVMTGTNLHHEYNNNILTSNNTNTRDEFRVSQQRGRNCNEMDADTEEIGHQEWDTEQMYWSGDGDEPDSAVLEQLLAQHQNSASIISFESNLSSNSTSFHSQHSDENSEARKLIEELIASLLSKVRSQNRVEASKILLTMSNTPENCVAMRQCGCLPMLIRLLHGAPEEGPGGPSNNLHHARRVGAEVRARAGRALRNVVMSQPDDKRGRREARVLKLLEQIREYSELLRNEESADDNRKGRCEDQSIGPSIAALMKLSFDEDHRYAMCQLGGLQAIADLLQADHEAHGCGGECAGMRRYSGMALTNLTFGDGANKALLCSMRPFMEALVAQLRSPSEDLRQVTASVLRNLSWRADASSKRILRDVGAVPLLVVAAMEASKESTLKSILSALWNLSAHCSANKADICAVEGALAFLVSTLTYRSKSRTLAIVENGGGILRNVSSHVAIQNEYRAILRRHNCLQILLQHLKSPSLTVVSNACGTLWNLSARNAADQRALWEMGAVGMLKKLINSKHKMISMGSSAALKNLLSARPPGVALGLCVHGDNYRCDDETPSLMVRKQKALSQEIDQNLSETYDNTDSPKTSPVKHATDNKQQRIRRHVSPSAARYLANQKLKNELSLPNREKCKDNNMSGSFVVEEKHNGAFQVTKNAQKGLNLKPGQRQDVNATTHHDADPNPKLVFRPAARAEKSAFTAVGPQEAVRQSKSVDSTRNGSPSPIGLKKEQFQSGIPKPSSSEPKNPHESRIPLPKSVSKLDNQRSQSSSPVSQRRNIPQRNVTQTETPKHSNSKVVDITETHPKYAWNSSPEKQDNDPEKPVNFTKRLGNDVPQHSDKPLKPLSARLQHDDCSEDELRMYKTENSPSNYSLASSTHDLDEVAQKTRCSLNIRTSTNVKMISNHPLLANAAALRGDEGKLFESRRNNKDKPFHNYENGVKGTMEFSVQSDYDIDESLCMMSRSSSADSVSSFEQHEEETDCADSDASRRTSNVASPSELSDCQTALTSPFKSCSSNYISLCGESTEMRTALAERMTGAELPLSPDETLYVDTQEPPSESDCLVTAFDEVQMTKPEATFTSMDDSDIMVLHNDPEDHQTQQRPVAIVHRIPPEEKDPPTLLKPEEVPALMRSSSSSFSSVDDISPADRQILEECIRTGMSQQVSQQKIPLLSFQLLRDTVEKHPQACSFERGNPLKNLEIKDAADYESLSENEEKGKEDERKAEKNRLFRIPESPVDQKKSTTAPDSCSRQEVDTRGNRRSEKNQNRKSTHDVPPVPSQLEFLMTKKDSQAVESTMDNVENPCVEENKNHLVTKKNSKPANEMGNCSGAKDKLQKSMSEKDVDCSEKQDLYGSDENMCSSTILDEAKEIAEALMGARAESTEDMTCSTLSCLSDIDNARPPSVMAEIDCLSMTNSCDENFKNAVTRECQKLFGKPSKQTVTKKSLLRELQMGRLAIDNNSDDISRGSNDSYENLSLQSSCTSELLGNVCPPSLLNDISLTASTGSLNGIDCDSDCEPERNLVGRYASNQDDISERMHDAAAMAQLYAKELSNITGNVEVELVCSNEIVPQINMPVGTQEVMEVTIADVTEIGSDTELEDDLPCDDEDPDSETLHKVSTKPFSNGEVNDGSTENLTFSLNDEQPREENDISPYFDFDKQSGCFMTTEEFKALQENADMILNTLKDIEISDEEENGEEDNSHGDMLDDETMSLVSNESDEECLSPEGRHPLKVSPRNDFVMSPSCNGMVGLPSPHGSDFAVPKSRKTSLPPRNKYSALPKAKDQVYANRCPESSVPTNSSEVLMKVPISYNGRSLDAEEQVVDVLLEGENGVFDSRTFTKKRASIPRDMVPSLPDNGIDQVRPTTRKSSLKSPMSSNSPSFPPAKAEPKVVESKISAAWKNAGKSRSKSAADLNRNSNMKIMPSSSSIEETKGYSPRSNPSPNSPLSNTFENLDGPRRPSSLALAQQTNSSRNSTGFPQKVVSSNMQKPTNEGVVRPRIDSKFDSNILSPNAQQSNIPKVPNKASLIPGRRSMIPMPAKYGLPEN
ncbi:hypothetical protein JTE90_015918 [Oedothorax gibbosus]|uniref:Adenomatous polyposis coli protein n=1 Tax=Oedothorax gibbosus TaxID=931172 RepID=A0AAV6U406_9ARAC|nr:hypothetical protein JTE90_015918 [Oedothorax gibbosus]